MHGMTIRLAGRSLRVLAIVVTVALIVLLRSRMVAGADVEIRGASESPTEAETIVASAAMIGEWLPRIEDPGSDVFAGSIADGDAGVSWTGRDARLVLHQIEAREVDGVRQGKITVDYPVAGTMFPPDLCPPTFLWHDPDERSTAWLIVVTFEDDPKKIVALATGARPQREIDPRCVTESNQWEEPPYQASARGWTPDERTWSILKQRSIEGQATVSIHGLIGMPDASPTMDEAASLDEVRIVSRGGVSISTSKDPVGAPVFYRDVPLMPTTTSKGLVKPLIPAAMPLIEWRLRYVSEPSAPVVLRDMPTCGNCHSFSKGGDTLAMDMDGPSGDKGAHVVKTVTPHMVIEHEDVFTWNSFKADPAPEQQKQSFGLFPRVSPDGQHVVATVHEVVHVRNYLDWKFLQTFYPTRGILAVFDRATREIRALPGADDTHYVQSNGVWSPDGSELVFIRAEARDNYGDGERAEFANDPRETQIQYDLYRIPFNDGEGGEPVPVAGASANGMSNSFPKFSPDGKWIVYVQAKNGLLMRPDSKLHIIPAEGGEARLMKCNTPRMNSWHSWSPNGRWLVFSSKWPSPFTQMYLTHIDEDGNDTPAVLIPNSTAANRAVNLPEFAAIAPGGLIDIATPAADYRRHLDKAGGLVKEKKFDLAIGELERSLALRSDFADTHFIYGNTLRQQGKLNEAVKHYRKAIDCNPSYRQAYDNLGVALLRLDRPAEGAAALARSLQINSSISDTHGRMGIAMRRLGRMDAAIRHFRISTELDPDFCLGHYEWAITLRQTGKLEEAATHFSEAIRLNPDHAPSEHDWGVTLSRLGQHDAAIEHYKKAVAIDPLFAAAHVSLGVALGYRGQYADAAMHYVTAIEIDPDHDMARNSLAMILAAAPDDAARDGQEALRHAEIVCQNTERGKPAFLLTLSAAQAELGRFDDALETLKEARRIAAEAGNTGMDATIRGFMGRFSDRQPVRITSH